MVSITLLSNILLYEKCENAICDNHVIRAKIVLQLLFIDAGHTVLTLGKMDGCSPAAGRPIV